MAYIVSTIPWYTILRMWKISFSEFKIVILRLIIVRLIRINKIDYKCVHYKIISLQMSFVSSVYTKPKNFDICFCVFLSTSANTLLPQGRLDTRLCFHILNRWANREATRIKRFLHWTPSSILLLVNGAYTKNVKILLTELSENFFFCCLRLS